MKKFIESYESAATRRAYREIIEKFAGKSQDFILSNLKSPRERSVLKTYLRFKGEDYDFLFRKVLRTKPVKRYGTISYAEAKEVILSPSFSNTQQVALGLMLFCGLRINEVVNVRLDTIKDHYLRVYGKGRKYRTVPVPEFLEDKIKTARFDTVGVTDVTIRRWVKKIAHMTGKKVYPHYLRKLYATQIYTTTPLAVVSKLLGHTSPTTTMKYLLDVNKEMMEKSMEAL